MSVLFFYKNWKAFKKTEAYLYASECGFYSEHDVEEGVEPERIHFFGQLEGEFAKYHFIPNEIHEINTWFDGNGRATWDMDDDLGGNYTCLVLQTLDKRIHCLFVEHDASGTFDNCYLYEQRDVIKEYRDQGMSSEEILRILAL